jgi:hypothetical protein
LKRAFLRVGSAIGIAVSVLSAQAVLFALAYAQSDYRYHGYRSHYREYNNPDAYPTGSNRWWEEMDRQDRGGRR